MIGVRQIVLIAAASAIGWSQTTAAQAPASQTASQAPASQAPASQARASQAPASKTPADPQQAALSTMAASIEKQRASVNKQVSAVSGKTPPPAASFFTVPWIDAPLQLAAPLNVAAFNVPACDPLP